MSPLDSAVTPGNSSNTSTTTTTVPKLPGGNAGQPGGGAGLAPGSIDWNATVSPTTLSAVDFPILGTGGDPLGIGQFFALVGPGHTPNSVGAQVAHLNSLKPAQRNQLGQILAKALGEKAKKTYTVSGVQSMLITAFHHAGESGAKSLSDYLNQQVTQNQQAGGTASGAVHVFSVPRVQQTTYTAADIQATADAVGQSLIGRKLNAQEMQGVLSIMNNASAAKAQADVAGAVSAQQANASTINAQGAPNAATSSGGVTAGRVSPQQVYQETLRQGGSQTQAAVAAALVNGIESNGDPTELSGGVGPAQGLFQFEPGTWTGSAGGGKNGLPGKVGQASWQQQITGFLNATRGDHFSAWGPDLVANSGNPNSASNPAYGYTGPPQPGSKVANMIAQLGLATGGGAGVTATATTSSGTTDVYQTPQIDTVPATPSQTEAATNFLETQRSPEYQANNLLKVFQMIQSRLASPDPSLNAHVRGTPLAMK